MPTQGFFDRLRNRRVIQWALTYLGGAWLVFQAVELLGARFDWPEGLLRSVPVVLGAGLLGALVLAWYHGERGRQRISGIELVMLAGILVIAGTGVALVSPGGQAGDSGSAMAADSADSRERRTGAGTGTTEGAPGYVAVEAEPGGASVYITPVTPPAGLAGHEPLASGPAPLEVALPPGEYQVRFEAENMNPVRMPLRVRSGDTARVRRQLVPVGPLTGGMVRVGAGPLPVGAEVGPAADEFVEAFLVDRHEVTNEAFRAFVSDGGYAEPAYWPDTLQLGGETVPRGEATDRLVDQSGMPGPRGWSGALYPDGRGSHPVTGITWYEARAYCRWADKTLPSWSQWWRAAHGDTVRTFPWGKGEIPLERRANFDLEGTDPVGSHALGASPYGAMDMAGNVREWLDAREEATGRRLVVGGSFQDPVYMHEPGHAEAFPPGYTSPAVGFRCVKALHRGGVARTGGGSG